MMLIAKATYRITDGHEEFYSKNEQGEKLTTGRFTLAYTGEMEGEGLLMELKNHQKDDHYTVYGLERFTGIIGEIQGSFVLEYSGKYENGFLTSVRKIVPDSGTADLKKISGWIDFDSFNAKEMSITLNYSFEDIGNHASEKCGMNT